MYDDDLEVDIVRIYQAHYEDVYRFVLYFTNNRNEAEDLTQEVFIRVLKALPKYDGRSQLKTWILAIAKNTSIDFYRKQKWRNLFSTSTLKEVSSDDILPDEVFEQKESWTEIEDAISRLKPQYRAIVLLRGVQELSTRETAEVLGCSESKVKTGYHRALKMIKMKLEGDMKGRYAR